MKLPDGYITASEWARRKGVSPQAARMTVAKGRIDGIIVHEGRYLIPENAKAVIGATFPVPELIKPEKPEHKEPEPIPDGMISMMDWARKNSLNTAHVRRLRLDGRLPLVEIEGRRPMLYLPENTPVPSAMRKAAEKPPKGYLSVSMWANKVGISISKAQSMIANSEIKGAIIHDKRYVIPEDTELQH